MPADQSIIILTKELGIKTIGWTVNKEKKIDRLIARELDYLLTDKIYPR